MLYSVKQLRQIEQSASKRGRAEPLMSAAGTSAAAYAEELISAPGQSAEQASSGPILVLAGPGNNGGDAFECAAQLARGGHAVHILHWPPKASKSGKPASSADREAALQKAAACTSVSWLAADTNLGDSYALVIDGLFGIGVSEKTLPPVLHKQIAQVNTMTCPVLALDIPSGLDADTGHRVAPIAVQATHTLTFIGDKPGLHTCDGRDFSGVVRVDDLGVAPALFPESQMTLNSSALFPLIRERRRHNSNKGSNGTVELIGGAGGMQGALLLASRAALFCGAGRVIAGFIDSPPAYDAPQPEIMCRLAVKMNIETDSVIVIGPGSGNSITSFELLSRALLAANLLVIDADALNLMAQQPALIALCNGRNQSTTILTPHPLEAARLLSTDVNTVQRDRLSAAKTIARRYSAIVILKGSGTVIADPDGNIVINPTGNAGLASGGTGDVLAGTCGALAAQHKNLWQAALAAVYMHGAAADNLVRQGVGPVGLCAGELLPEIRKIVNQ